MPGFASAEPGPEGDAPLTSEPTTYGLDSKGLAELLRIAVERDPGEVLEAMLERPRTREWSAKEADGTGRPRQQTLPPDRRSLGEVLLDRSTPLEVLEGIKRHSKRMARRRRDEAEHGAAVSVYYAAIASALAFHGEKISSQSWKDLARSFAALVRLSWMPEGMTRHFRTAQAACRRRGRGDG